MDAECRRLVAPVLMLGLFVLSSELGAQVRVNPSGVNVNAQGATTVFLTFGGIDSYIPMEATWCGELMPAVGGTGLQCVPGTIFGQLPARFDRSRASGLNAFTDIMTIPASVARRAYQDAAAGASSAFFYVRRFRSPDGAPDQYVAVTCRMTGGGARTPLSLTNVRIAFNADVPMLQVEAGGVLPPIEARIDYTGTGRLSGRWEIVMPGEELPSTNDLLTEATLPLEERSRQRRYTQLTRFNVFLPPTGRVVLPAPDPTRFPTTADGVYHLLLRVEATSEKEGDSNLGAVGAGDGVVNSGAVAGFPMPVLRYVVGSNTTPVSAVQGDSRSAGLLAPLPSTTIAADSSFAFRWHAIAGAHVYHLEVEHVHTRATAGAVLAGGATRYDVPPWFREQVGNGSLRWRIIGTDVRGRQIASSPWWYFDLGNPP